MEKGFLNLHNNLLLINKTYSTFLWFFIAAVLPSLLVGNHVSWVVCASWGHSVVCSTVCVYTKVRHTCDEIEKQNDCKKKSESEQKIRKL